VRPAKHRRVAWSRVGDSHHAPLDGTSRRHDRRSEEPLSRPAKAADRIIEELRIAIASGRLGHGDRLPNEPRVRKLAAPPRGALCRARGRTALLRDAAVSTRAGACWPLSFGTLGRPDSINVLACPSGRWRTARVPFAQIEPAEPGLPMSESRSLPQAAFVPGITIERYGRFWRMGQVASEQGEGKTTGRIGYERVGDIAELWDEQARDFKERRLREGVTSPRTVAPSTVVPLRGQGSHLRSSRERKGSQ
jgi:hypothetical protein